MMSDQDTEESLSHSFNRCVWRRRERERERERNDPYFQSEDNQCVMRTFSSLVIRENLHLLLIVLKRNQSEVHYERALISLSLSFDDDDDHWLCQSIITSAFTIRSIIAFLTNRKRETFLITTSLFFFCSFDILFLFSFVRSFALFIIAVIIRLFIKQIKKKRTTRTKN